MMPPLCRHHRSVYAIRAHVLTKGANHPERGMKALRHEAALVAGQCPACPDPKETSA